MRLANFGNLKQRIGFSAIRNTYKPFSVCVVCVYVCLCVCMFIGYMHITVFFLRDAQLTNEIEWNMQIEKRNKKNSIQNTNMK